MSIYEYKPLDLSRREFRLLHILPENDPKPEHASSAAPVRYTVIYASLNDAQEYNALSYTWGDGSATIPILVDGIEFRATANLEAGLRQLGKDEIITL